ncbi:hypothetical protein KUC3_36740 [Alteromonas sp. KC3]|uniref:hypothetical protein n=1 Tax=unclassified Alteromonas TaxID=2614992 RepID=UPI0019237305|nr:MULTISPECIES: hypothetical protein [unclassified Alteromonas]BCO20817.1 hypothetical protein KUC3_36740 [Alteromonas sp. KC3]BCO24787.1 hypothetical protein KUC14_36560 [Alteromonas sp. KC14]
MLTRYTITTLLCLTLLMQNALALGLAAFSMQQAQAFTGDDIELICTGKTMRYISISATELEGEFIFVSPELLKAPTQSVDCTNGTLADLPQSDDIYTSDLANIEGVRYQALVARIAQQPYTAFAYAAPLSRAPPRS